MKTPGSDSEQRWEKLVQQARADAGPPANLEAVVRAVHSAQWGPPEGWGADLHALLAASRIIPFCLAGIAASGAFALWEVWDWWDTLPWAQFLAATAGGGA